MEKSTVADKAKWLEKYELPWRKVDTLAGGTEAMREARTDFLPQAPRESRESYEYRRMTSTLFNVFLRTLNNLAGKPFKEPISWSDETLPQLVEWFADIDLQGNNLHVFSAQTFFFGMHYGLHHILIDYPRTDGLKTAADEKVAGTRPYAVHVKAPAVLGFKTARIGGKESLTQFRYKECVTLDTDEFGSEEVEQIRVLEIGKWSIYRKDDDKEDWVLAEKGVTTLNFIPVLTFYTNRCGYMEAMPPLIDIADLNIKHWQSGSDQDMITHTARVPILAVIGVEDSDPIEIGAKSAVKIPQGGDMKYVEHSGAAIAAGQASLLALEEQMRLLGAEILQKGPGRMTATQAAIETSQQQSYLSSLVEQLEDFLDQMVGMMAQWANLTNTGEIEVFNDFMIADFDATTQTLLLNAANAGKISDETLFNEFQRRGTVSDEAGTWEEESARIAAQPPPLGASMMTMDGPAPGDPKSDPQGDPSAAGE